MSSDAEAPTTDETTLPPVPNRRQVLRELMIFQLKLALDGLRDVFLSPVSIIAGLVGILFSPSEPRRYLARIMTLGHQSDRFINLFGYADIQHPSHSSDAYVKHLEELVVSLRKAPRA